MKIKKSVSPVTADDKGILTAALQQLGGKNPSFEEIRAAMPADKRARFTDGMMHQTALELGLTVLV